MTFDKIVSNANEEVFGMKVSFGNEMRRLSFTGTSFAALSELVSKLFEVDQGSSVLKYVDDDGDKISMSSDAELQEAIRISKGANKTVRLVLEVKTATPPPPPADQARNETAAVEQPQYPFFCGRRGGRGGRGSWGGPFHHGGFPQRGGFPRQGGFPHHGDIHGYGPGPQYHDRHHPRVDPCGPGAKFEAVHAAHHGPFYHGWGSPALFAHGTFSPADTTVPPAQWESKDEMKAQRKAFKEHKVEMIKTLREMKEKAVTEDDKQAVKEFKETMKAHFKEAKCAWRESMKGQKENKKDKCRKEKKDKCRKEKEARLMARHVVDVTIPDGAELPADTPVVKTWKIRNAGVTQWPAGSQLIFLNHKGDNLNGPERVVLADPVQPQEEVDVSVPLITPSEPGRYVGFYRMTTPDGVKFGQRIWVSFVVTAPTAPPTTATTQTNPVDMVE